MLEAQCFQVQDLGIPAVIFWKVAGNFKTFIHCLCLRPSSSREFSKQKNKTKFGFVALFIVGKKQWKFLMHAKVLIIDWFLSEYYEVMKNNT